jgi:putative transposase
MEPGNPWQNGSIKEFNGKMRDEYLAGESFYSLKDSQVLIEIWRQHDNTVRLHSSTDYTPPTHPAVPPLVIGIRRLHYLKL